MEAPYEGEDRCVIPSPKVATYDLKPEMSAPEVAAECVKRIESGKYDVVILNFANCDMVGHTGVFDAAVKAVETVDTCAGRVAEAMTLAMLSDSLVMPSMSSVSPLFSLVMISSEIFIAANISELTRADEEFCSRRRASQFSSLADRKSTRLNSSHRT